MYIINLTWDEDNISHIARHRVFPEEVEELCFGSSSIETGRQNLYYVTGQTASGRYLFVVVKYLGRGNVKVITARDMDNKEKSRYKRGR